MMTGCRQSPGSTCARRGMGRLWRGMGGDRPPRRQHGRLGFHRPRDTKHGFSLFLRRLQGEQPQARPTGFSRNTKHETRITAFMLFFPRFPTISRHFPRFPGPPHPPGKGSARRSVAAFLRVVARHRAAMARHGRPTVPRAGNTADWVFTRNESRNMFSPCPPATPRRATPSPANGVFTNHESRDTNHGLYAFAAAFLRIVVRHGAAMARHGRPSSPAPATRPIGFSPATNHATCFPPVLRRLQGEQPQARPTGFSRITKHETRITAFMLFTSNEIAQHGFSLSSGDSKESNPKPGQRVFHESRNTNHESRLFTLP